MDNLARNAILARKAGMSYWQWKALHPVTAEGKEEKPNPRTRDIVCAFCGKIFTTDSKSTARKYCDDECRIQMWQKMQKERRSAVASKAK